MSTPSTPPEAPEPPSDDGTPSPVSVGPRQEVYDEDQGARIEEAVRTILEAIGENPDRDALQDTPGRVARSLQYLTQGYLTQPREMLRSALFEERYDEIILVRDIEIYSLCEHHLLPFFGKAHIGYIPDGQIVGLSKLARVVDGFARRLQVQERMTLQIRDAIEEVLDPQGVAVVIEAKHLCMIMRGVEKQHSVTTTSAMSGAFEQESTRGEFMQLIQNGA